MKLLIVADIPAVTDGQHHSFSAWTICSTDIQDLLIRERIKINFIVSDLDSQRVLKLYNGQWPEGVRYPWKDFFCEFSILWILPLDPSHGFRICSIKTLRRDIKAMGDTSPQNNLPPSALTAGSMGWTETWRKRCSTFDRGISREEREKRQIERGGSRRQVPGSCSFPTLETDEASLTAQALNIEGLD